MSKGQQLWVQDFGSKPLHTRSAANVSVKPTVRGDARTCDSTMILCSFMPNVYEIIRA